MAKFITFWSSSAAWQRLSLRTSLIITIVAMGVLGLMLALLSGAIYRNQAIE